MPRNKNAVIRYRALDKCFSDFRHRYYIEDLIEACGNAIYEYNGEQKISRRQVYEDIKFMESEQGYSIPLERYKDGKKTYYRYTDADFSISKQPLTDDEIRQLRTTILTLQRYRNLPCNEWLEEVISNLEYRFNLNGNTNNAIGFEQNPYLKGAEYLSMAIEAITHEQTLSITYKSYEGKVMHWTLHPYYVKQYNNRWFLFGLNNTYITNIPLDRIEEMVYSNTPYIRNTNIDFEEYFDDIVGVTFPKTGKKEMVILRFAHERFPYVTSKPLHHSQKIVNRDECTISVEVIPNKELQQLLFSFGPDVEVLSPSSLREDIKAKIAELSTKYFAVQKDCTDA